MASPRYFYLDSSVVNFSAAKNILITALVSFAGVGASLAASHFLVTASWASLLKDTWIIQGVLVAAVVALIYRLQSDIGSLAGLSAQQRAQLDSMVTVKLRRLWGLFFAIAISALLPRIASAITGGGQVRLLLLATFLQTATALMCAYLPGMWQELRRFTTDMIAEKERRARQQAELARLAEASKDA